MRERKIIDINTDNLIPPWEYEDKTIRIKQLQFEYYERQKKGLEEEKKKEKLTEKTTSKKEEKDLKQKAEKIKKLYALDYWMRCFNRVSFCNEMAGQALFHVCIGQSLNTFKIELEDDSEIDWRLHFLWIQDSSSGKGRAMNFVNRIFKSQSFQKFENFDDTKIPTYRPYKTHKLGRMNAAALINTFEKDKKGNLIKDQSGYEKIKLGILEANDFIFSEEARALLESSHESLDLQEIFMTGMETIGSSNNIFNKQLTDYTCACDTRTTASFALTTRPFGKVKQTLVESGMMQRLLFFPKKLVYEDRVQMNKLSSFAFKTKKLTKPFQPQFDELIEELKKVIKFSYENYIQFDENKIDELLSFIYEKIMWFTKDIEDKIPSEDNKYILQSFVGRYKDNMVVMAFHSAAMRFSKIVERQDLQYAFDFFKDLYNAQKLWVSLTVEEDKDTKSEEMAIKRDIERILLEDKNESITLPELIAGMSKKYGKAYEAMRYHIIKFTKGSNPFIELVENVTDKRKKFVRLIK